MNLNKNKLIQSKFLHLTAFILCAFALSPTLAVSENVLKAQEAFLEKDYSVSMMSIGRALREKNVSNSELKNLAGLYRQITANSSENIDLGWKLPESVLKLRVVVTYFDFDGEKTYRFGISGNLKSGTEIKWLTLKKYPDLLVIDTAQKIGRFEQGSFQGDQYFNARIRSQSLPISAGSYLLDFELTNGDIVKGWFIVTEDLNPNQTPSLLGVNPGMTFTSTTPRFTWTQIDKSQLQSFETRNVRFSISPMINDQSWGEAVWNYTDPTGNATSIDLASDGPSSPPLAPIKTGDYVISVNYTDARIAKPIKIVREYRVGRKVKFKISDPN